MSQCLPVDTMAELRLIGLRNRGVKIWLDAEGRVKCAGYERLDSASLTYMKEHRAQFQQILRKEQGLCVLCGVSRAVLPDYPGYRNTSEHLPFVDLRYIVAVELRDPNDPIWQPLREACPPVCCEDCSPKWLSS